MTKLEQLISNFGEKNELVKALKKETGDLSNSIKGIMQEDNVSKLSSNGFVANLSTIKSETF